MSENVFDFKNVLDWARARVVRGVGTGPESDKSATLRWDIPVGAFQAARKWWCGERTAFNDASIPHQSFPGWWRTVAISEKVESDRSGDNAFVAFEVEIAEGWYSSLSDQPAQWVSARYMSVDSGPGSATAATDSVATGAAPNKVFYVRFPFINPKATSACIASLSALTFTDPLVDGETLTGTWKSLGCAVKIEEDQTASIILTIADPQFVLNLYSDIGGVDEAAEVRIWRIPEAYAQGIADAWKTANPTGSSATADYDHQNHVVHLTLRKKLLGKPNLTTEALHVQCDTQVVYHFAWGYTKTEVGEFLVAHGGAPTWTGSTLIGVTRTIDVRTRGDGLFDAIVTETYRQFDAAKHLFSVNTFSGLTTGYVAAKAWGWMVPLAQLTTYSTSYTTRAVNQESDFNVTRKDDCTFDYEAVLKTTTGGVFSLIAGGTGITLEYTAKSDDPDPIPAVSVNRRERLDVNGRYNSKGSKDWEMILRRVQRRSGVLSHGPFVLYWGSNEDDAPTISADHKLTGGSITAKDDSSLDWLLSAQDTTAAPSITRSIAGGAFVATLDQKDGIKPEDIPDANTAADKGQVGVLETDLDARSGLGRFTRLLRSFNPSRSPTLRGGSYLFPTEIDAVQNARDADSAFASVPLTKGQSRRVNVGIDEITGKMVIEAETASSVESDEVVDSESDGLKIATVRQKRNAVLPYSLSEGEVGITQSRINDDGKLDVIKRTLALEGGLGTLTQVRRVRSNKVDWKFEQSKDGASSHQSFVDDDGTRYTNEYQKIFFNMCRTKTVQLMEMTVEDTYALSRAALLPLPTSSLPGDGMEDVEVELVAEGLWRRRVIRQTNGEPVFTNLDIAGWQEWAHTIELFSGSSTENPFD